MIELAKIYENWNNSLQYLKLWLQFALAFFFFFEKNINVGSGISGNIFFAPWKKVTVGHTKSLGASIHPLGNIIFQEENILRNTSLQCSKKNHVACTKQRTFWLTGEPKVHIHPISRK